MRRVVRYVRTLDWRAGILAGMIYVGLSWTPLPAWGAIALAVLAGLTIDLALTYFRTETKGL